jgi:hypothetical protein
MGEDQRDAPGGGNEVGGVDDECQHSRALLLEQP